MALPASGQISFNDVRIEMGQPSYTNYEFQDWSLGYAYIDPAHYLYTPINVNSSNAGKYSNSCGLNIKMSDWYGYNHTANYASDGTWRELFFSACYDCFPMQYWSSMIVFDLGTTNKNYDIRISGGTNEFQDVTIVRVYYGKFWTSDGSGGSNTGVYTINPVSPPIDITIQYDYVYDSGVGQYLYVVIYH